jgi:hypothetical protein
LPDFLSAKRSPDMKMSSVTDVAGYRSFLGIATVGFGLA